MLARDRVRVRVRGRGRVRRRGRVRVRRRCRVRVRVRASSIPAAVARRRSAARVMGCTMLPWRSDRQVTVGTLGS